MEKEEKICRASRTILLLEDDSSLNRGISFKLEKEGYQVLSCSGVKEGYRLFKNNVVQLILCDIMLEDGDGMEFCKKIRNESNVHFLFLTALEQEIDMVMGYEAGADDYITKPFSLAVLMSKVAAVFKRMETKPENKIVSGNICFYTGEMKVFAADRQLQLTKNEWKLLQLFLENPRQILSKQQILESLFDADGNFAEENTAAVNIKRLREKIEENPAEPEYIKNIRGMGYLWDKECQRC